MTVPDGEANANHKNAIALRELQESPLIVISEISKGPVSIETADVFVCYMLRVQTERHSGSTSY
jgi:aspartate carbamoyltransferase catalytic subunit